MVGTVEVMDPIELHKAGMKALVHAIGDVNAQEFVNQCRGTPGWDFGEWLNAQPEQTPDEIEAEIERIQADNAATGRYADKMIK